MSVINPVPPQAQTTVNQQRTPNWFQPNWFQTMPQAWQSVTQAVPQVVSQNLNWNQMAQGLNTLNTYGGEELLPLLAPRAAAVAPWLTPGYVGMDVFNQARKTYAESADLSRNERLQKTVIQTGDMAAFHLLGTIGLPLLLVKPINKAVHHLLAKPGTPVLLSKHPNWVSTGVVLASMVALSKPIRALTEFILDWTYRPMLEKKRREEVQQLWQAQMNQQLQRFQTQPFLKHWTGSSP